MKHSIIIAVWTLCLAAITACQPTATTGGAGEELVFAYARLVRLSEQDGVRTATIADPWRQGQPLQTLTQGGGDTTLLPSPLRRVVVFTATHCQLLEWLGLGDRIVGVADARYIHVPTVEQGLKKGTITDCGSAMGPDIERIIALKPDAVIVSPFEGSGGFGRLEKIGIPVIQAADYMESSALGRAEWMRYYGRLFGLPHRADSLFHVVDSSYQALKAYAATLPKGKSILTERKTGATWYTPGGRSTIATVIADANGGYAFSDDTHSGSLAMPFEQILDKAGQSDIWVFKVYGNALMSKADLLSEFHGYEALKAFQTGEIYECNTMTSRYFEEVPFRPDLLLREMIILLHDETNLGKLRYHQKL